MLSPPVPLAFVKSPPWHMNPGMMRWKHEPSKRSSAPDFDRPKSPQHNARKFSAVLGTWLPYRPKTIRPASWPLMSTSKNTLVVIEVSPGGGRSLCNRNSQPTIALSRSRIRNTSSSSFSQYDPSRSTVPGRSPSRMGPLRPFTFTQSRSAKILMSRSPRVVPSGRGTVIRTSAEPGTASHVTSRASSGLDRSNAEGATTPPRRETRRASAVRRACGKRAPRTAETVDISDEGR